MKNKLLKIFTAIFACATLALCFTACNDEHTHNYVETVTQPTCTSLGYTTHTCECGDSYVNNYVNTTSHHYDEVITQPTCTTLGYTTHTCTCGASYVDSYVNIIPHSYTQAVIKDSYLKDEATCTQKAIYYKSCMCGQASTIETFENGNTIAHEFNQEIPEPRYIKDEATCIQKTVYYKSCACGFASQTDTFSHGNLTSTHVADDSGWCVDCNKPIQATKGLRFKEQGIYATVVGYTGESNKVNIPSTYNNLPVTSISKRAFENCSTLTNIIIPNSITALADYAFDSCTSLTSVVIPDSVTTIGAFVFEDCSNLTDVTIGNGVTSIDSYPFYNCDKLTYTIKDNAKYLGNKNNPYLYLSRAVSTDITTVEIDKNCKLIAPFAFSNCSNLGNITIPNGVTFIGNCAFTYCSNLKSISIPDSITFIGWELFYSCDKLTYTLENSLRYLGNANNPYLYLVDTNSTAITNTTINTNCKLIGANAFENCSNITTLKIPASVTFIGHNAFYNCQLIANLYIADIESWCNISLVNPYSNPISCASRIYIDNEAISELIIPETITEIKDYAFYGYNNLTNVILPNTITSIGICAFDSCKNLQSINIPADVTSIGYSAFSDCTKLISITLPIKVTSIDEYAFSGCTSLTIYCQAEVQPNGWNYNWNPLNRPVILIQRQN